MIVCGQCITCGHVGLDAMAALQCSACGGFEIHAFEAIEEIEVPLPPDAARRLLDAIHADERWTLTEKGWQE